MRVAAVCCCFFVSLAWTQCKPGSEPSPMEAFANRQGVRTTWSSQIANLGKEGTQVLLTAVVLDSAGAKMRGVKIELSSGDAHDTIYLGEEATDRTRAALNEIADEVAHGTPGGNGCVGARQFWPLYDWPWNKYHELNADVCGEKSVLVLYGRGRAASYSLPGESPTAFAAILARAISDLNEH